MNKNLLILGAGQYGQVAKEIAESMGCFDNVSLLEKLHDNNENTEKPLEFVFAFVAISGMNERLKLTRILEECGYQIVALISPKSFVSTTATLGKGVLVEPFAAINSQANIQDCCYVGANATIDCGTLVGEGSTICCGATVVDNTLIKPMTEVQHGQICYGEKISTKTPEGNTYCFEDGM